MPGDEGMKPAYPGVKLTYDDYVHFPEDGQRHELIDGEHVVTPTPNRKHQSVSMNLAGMSARCLFHMFIASSIAL